MYIMAGPHASNYLMPLIEYNSSQKKIDLWLYAVYDYLYNLFNIDLPSGTKRTDATKNAVRFHNMDEYAKYVKANKK